MSKKVELEERMTSIFGDSPKEQDHQNEGAKSASGKGQGTPSRSNNGYQVEGDNNIVTFGDVVLAKADPALADTPKGKRKDDQFISLSQAAKLRSLVETLTTMEAQRENGQKQWAIWKQLSDHCDVPAGPSDVPRYQLISNGKFYQAKCFLLEWKIRLLENPVVQAPAPESEPIPQPKVDPQPIAEREKHWLVKCSIYLLRQILARLNRK